MKNQTHNEKNPPTLLEILLRLKIQKMEGDISPREQSLLFKQNVIQIFSRSPAISV